MVAGLTLLLARRRIVDRVREVRPVAGDNDGGMLDPAIFLIGICLLVTGSGTIVVVVVRAIEGFSVW